MSKKICFFSGDITRSGGTERVSSQIANGLVRDSTYEICFLSLVEQEKEPFFHLDSAITRYSLGDHWINPGPGYLPLIGKLRKFLKEQQIDVIIDIDIVLDVLSIPAAKGLHTKVISWEHFNAEFELSVWYRKMILRYSVKHSDYAVVLTNGDLQDYRALLGREQSITRIYNPVAFQLQKHTDSQPQNIIVTVGRLVPEKGIRHLKKVALQILEQNPDWKWILLGDGILREELESFIQSHYLQNRLILAGTVDNVDAYLQQASIFVTTSEYEGLGLSILEARELKVPCVCFNVKMGPWELIENEIDGFLIPPFDCDEMARKIQLLIESPKLRSQLAEQAYLKMSEFRENRILDQWKEMIDSLLEKGTQL